MAKAYRLDAQLQKKLRITAEGLQELVVDAHLERVEPNILVEYLADAEESLKQLRTSIEKTLG